MAVKGLDVNWTDTKAKQYYEGLLKHNAAFAAQWLQAYNTKSSRQMLTEIVQMFKQNQGEDKARWVKNQLSRYRKHELAHQFVNFKNKPPRKSEITGV